MRPTEAISREIARAQARIENIDGVLRLKPEEEAAARLKKRREQWVAYRSALMIAQDAEPPLSMRWGSHIEV